MAVITAASGNNTIAQPHVQNAVDSANAGDTVVIPSGTFTWDKQLTINKGFNIKIIGGSATSPTWATRPKIHMVSGLTRFIVYTLSDSTPRKTAEIGYLDFEGNMNGYHLELLGETSIQRVAGPPVTYIGGIRIHHCSWSWLYTSVPGGNGWFHAEGWMEGVMDHCEFNNPNLNNYHAKNAELNTHRTSPSGGGIAGDYTYRTSLLDDGRQELGGGLHAFYWEDCIIHHGSKAFTDTGGSTNDGGAIWCVRHSTMWGAIATHGTRETGSRQWGARLIESYNNHYVRSMPSLQTNFDTGTVESRNGEQIYYNNHATGQPGASGNALNNYGGDCSNYLISYCQSDNFFWYGPDGVCPWDDNQKGKYTESTPGFPPYTHEPYVGYTFSKTGDGSIFGGKTTVVNGIDTTTGLNGAYFSDVYGKVTGGTPNTGRTQITGCTISGTNLPNPIPINYFYGFVIRNPNLARSSQVAFSVILRSTAGTVASPNVINLTLAGLNIGASGSSFVLNYDSSGMELRKIRQYFAGGGHGSMPIPLVQNPNNSILNLAILQDGTTHWQDVVSGGVWRWGNMVRSGANAFTPDQNANLNEPIGTNGIPPNANTGIRAFAIVGGYHHYNGGVATNIVPGGGGVSTEFQPLFTRGYQWNPSVSAAAAGAAGPQATRVGADWGRDWRDPSNNVLMSTIGPDSPDPTTGSTTNTVTPYFASFNKPGVGGLAYPHPLVALPAAVAPTITSGSTCTFIVGTANPTSGTSTVIATGDPTIAFSTSTGAGQTGKPSWLSVNSSTGAITGTPPTGSAGTYTFNITATNSTGSDTDAFTATVTVGISIALTSPTDGQTFANAPVNIALQATITGGSGSETVNFNQVTIPPTTDVLIGSDTTGPSPYTFTWTGVAAGTYNVQAKSGSNTSGVATITVSDPVVAPLDPPTIVVTG